MFKTYATLSRALMLAWLHGRRPAFPAAVGGRWRRVAVSPLCVVPTDPLQGFPLDPGHGFPRAEELDDLGPEQADDAFRQGIVTTVANAADRGVNPGLRQTFGIADCEILAAAVPVMDQRDGSTRCLQPDTAGRPPGSGRPARSPSSSTSRRASRRSCGRGHQ